MIQVNEYYDGKVKSMTVSGSTGKFTVGAMAPGEYVFSTASIEIMTMIVGEMKVILPGSEKEILVKPFESFRVEKDQKFKVIIEELCSYRCEYL